MSPPHRVRAPTAPVPKEPLPSPREPGLSFRQGARTRRGPGHEDARRRLAKTLPRGERSGRFLPNGVSSLPEQLRTTRKNLTACPPKKKPLSQCILCSSAPGSGPTGCPPHPSPRCLIVPASRLPAPNGFLRSCLFPSSCLRDARALGSCLSPEIRHRRAGGRPRPAATIPRSRAAFVWDPEEKKKKTGVISGFTAPEKVLAHPQAQKGRQAARGSPPPHPPQSVPSVLSGDAARVDAMALELQGG